MIKNPNWQEATSWLFTKRGRVESGTTENKSKPEVGPGTRACKPNAPTTTPCCLLLPLFAYSAKLLLVQAINLVIDLTQESEEMRSNSLDCKLKAKEVELKRHEQEIADQDEVWSFCYNTCTYLMVQLL